LAWAGLALDAGLALYVTGLAVHVQFSIHIRHSDRIFPLPSPGLAVYAGMALRVQEQINENPYRSMKKVNKN